MNQQFSEDLLAELAALNMAVHKALNGLAELSGDRRAFLHKTLEEGLVGLRKSRYWSIPDERLETFLENASARYTDIITSIPAD